MAFFVAYLKISETGLASFATGLRDSRTGLAFFINYIKISETGLAFFAAGLR